jgi:hypothetical protein
LFLWIEASEKVKCTGDMIAVGEDLGEQDLFGKLAEGLL